MFSNTQARKLVQRRLPDLHRTGALSPTVSIMEHDDLIICSEPQVAFDTRAHFKRSGERDKAIFGKARSVMQAPVSKTGWPRIERVRA